MVATRKCIFLDSKNQQITYKSFDDPAFVEVEHEDGWYLRVPQKDLNQIRAAHTTASILSPFSFLYLKYKEKSQEGVLWCFIFDDEAFFATFKDGKPIFTKIIDELHEYNLEDLITGFLHQFYDQEESYFIERIEIFYEEGSIYEDPDLEDRLLLPIGFNKIDTDQICQNPAVSKYFFTIKKNSGMTIGMNKKFVMVVGVAVLALLLLYDLFLKYQTHTYTQKIHQLVDSQMHSAEQNNEYQSKILRIERIKPIIMQLRDRNELLATKLKNLFDLVPDTVYLTKFELNERALHIEGVAKDRRAFLLGLNKKLATIYKQGSYDLKRTKGGYRFVATYEEVQHD